MASDGEESGRWTRRKKPAKPLTAAILERAAVRYLQRHPASVRRFHQVMKRKIDRAHGRCPGDASQYPQWLEAAEQKCRRSGLLDDSAFAGGVAKSLHRRGLGIRAIRQRLRQKGLVEPEIGLAIEALSTGEVEPDLKAAIYFARKKRLGPFGPETRDPRAYRRQMGAFARRGFGYDVVQRILGSDLETLEAVLERENRF